MKKTLLIGAALLAIAGGTSCNNKESVITQNYTQGALNIITDLDNGNTYTSVGRYFFDLDITKQTGYVEVSNLIINNNSLTFKTENQEYITLGPDVYFKDVTITSQNIKDANFLLTPFFYTPANVNIPGTFRPQFSYEVVAQFYIGDEYMVKTFQPITFYKGTTTTGYNTADGPATFDTETIYYQLTLDTEKNKGVIEMFNAKFSGVPAEPAKQQIILEDLDVEYVDGGIKVSGEEIVPLVVMDGGEPLPTEGYTFDFIEFQTTNFNLTQCQIDYSVAGRYTGTFKGAYAETSYLDK